MRSYIYICIYVHMSVSPIYYFQVNTLHPITALQGSGNQSVFSQTPSVLLNGEVHQKVKCLLLPRVPSVVPATAQGPASYRHSRGTSHPQDITPTFFDFRNWEILPSTCHTYVSSLGVQVSQCLWNYC